MTVTDEMVENGCRGMYGKHWDGPEEKMPGEEMKNVWRELARKCLESALPEGRPAAAFTNGDGKGAA